ncbi:Uncharacterised protein [Vibrio cholerae]|nr:Uncharacterised protein [Vibrio cholerae]
MRLSLLHPPYTLGSHALDLWRQKELHLQR